jgi:4-aminobutyrate aminotransferase-like enzyme
VNQVNTYGGHPVAAAVALRNIEILLEEHLPERAAEHGRYLLDGLNTLRKHACVGDVRGLGLLTAVELVLDRCSKAIMPGAHTQKLIDYCKTRGIIVGRSTGSRFHGNCLVMAPPLVFTRAEIDRLVTVLDEGLSELTASLPHA